MRQRNNECLLWAICAAYNTDYETASDCFELDNKHTWGKLVGHYNLFSQDPLPILQDWCSKNISKSIDLSWIENGFRITPGAPRDGVITVRWPCYGQPAARHAMLMLDNGMVHDPQDDTVYDNIQQWEREYPDWVVE
jgi:hypothetical protein